MGTENLDTERMHRLFDDALADVDLTGDVVPAALTGYERKVRTRRYQGAGVALAVLATAGVAVSALPRGSSGGAGDAGVAAGSNPPSADYCTHQYWSPAIGTIMPGELTPDPSPYEANCHALQTALKAVFPTAYVVPTFTSYLARDSRVDQALLAKVNGYEHSDPVKWSTDMAKYFGSELKYLALHPDDPANVYAPNQYELVTPAGRETMETGSAVPGAKVPSAGFVGTIESADCSKMPPILKGKDQCTSVGLAGGWQGSLWSVPAGGVDEPKFSAVMTKGQDKSVFLTGNGDDYQAWYHEGMYVKNMGDAPGADLPGNTWINRWTGEKAHGTQPPVVHALSQAQWQQFVNSPGFQTFADSYRSFLDHQKLPKPASHPSSAAAH